MQKGERLFRTFLDLWKALPREQGGVPLKRSFKPARAADLMPHLFLSEVRGKYDLHIRLVGSAMEENESFRLTGSNYFDKLDRADWDFYEDFIEGYRAQPCAGRLLRQIKTSQSTTYDVHTLGVPLADEDGGVRYVLGAGFMVLNHAESSRMLPGDNARDGSGSMHIERAEYIDLGHGVPAVVPARRRVSFP
ncbi:PAS domain-containing protein [Kordiimonas aestuarii]|uniref:PAS domain-containing protein n=1 Tax=Kordiimonas aestuarii TaxID=1005925 RepID=UPI0021CF9C9B|nr:PAS domain-containing protein [Kordiimonas aestuarii]